MGEIVVKNNTVARVHYTGTLPDSGEVFDSSEGRDPLTFLVGHGKMIPGFERELMGAKIGERRTFTLAPEDAYGQPIDEAIMDVPRAQFAMIEEQTELEVGMQLITQLPHGPAPFIVKALTDESVTADFNHKLAGESLTFSVEVVELREADESEIAHGHAHGPGGVEH
tara:strand:- start:637 stop:1140 length:504 start_codon:yes stop_codon:yes gene_type:complete